MFVTLADKTLFYERHLGKEPVLLLHGWGGSHLAMKGVYEFLSKWNCDVVNLDFFGFGQSEEPPATFGVEDYAAAVSSLLSKLKLENVTVVGHSFGGRIAILLAADPRVKNIVLIDAAGLKPKRGIRYRRRVRAYNRAKQKGEDLSEFGSDDYRRLTPAMQKVFTAVVNRYLEKEAAAIEKPTYIFWGENDLETPLWMGKKLCDLIAGSTLTVYPGGHYSYLDNFTPFCSRLLQIIKGEL